MSNHSSDSPTARQALRRELFRLAREQDDIACAEGAAVPYWASSPPSTQGHRAAAAALREAADQIVA